MISNSNSVVNDFKSVKSTDFNFTHKSLELKHSMVINEYGIYDIVNLKGLAHNLKNETTVSIEGKPLRL